LGFRAGNFNKRDIKPKLPSDKRARRDDPSGTAAPKSPSHNFFTTPFMLPTINITPKGVQWFQRGSPRGGHPWIYATDIVSKTTDVPGIVTVFGPNQSFLAQALYSPASQIALRILSRSRETIDKKWFEGKIAASIKKRNDLEIPSTAKRLVFAEADGIPSLIVDQYESYLVVQTLSAGLEKFKTEIFEILKKLLNPKGILERNDVSVRRKEKLPEIKECVYGEVPKQIIITEGDLKFFVDLWTGQKTGAFLDQRENRLFAGHKAEGNVLDVFSYQGWFACHMARKAKSVLCVESSKEACAKILENAKLNGLESKITIESEDGFDFLKNADRAGKHFDTINLDPPAFIKTGAEREQGFRGYKEINLRAMKLLKPRGTLITSSCSYHFSIEDFEEMLDVAAQDANVDLDLICQTGPALDHPTLPNFPEGNYLKCYFLNVKSA